jgi:TPR repeat protein
MEYYADADTPASQNNLALVYDHQRDFKQAEPLYISSAQDGNLTAMYNLACMYYTNGDFVNADKWFTIAAHSGDPDAMKRLSQQ